MSINLGVTVVEVDGKSSPAIPAAPTSTAGFLVRSQRGAPDTPVRVRGFADFVANFGGYTADAFGAYAVRGFFDNGGSDAYVVRVAGPGAQAAEVVVPDQSSAPTLRLRAGARGVAEPGAWGDALSVAVETHPLGQAAVPAQVVGSTAEPFALTDGATAQFTVTTRGVAQASTVTFRTADFAAIGAASAQEVAAAINRQTTAVRAAVTPGGNLAVAVASTDPRVWSRLAATTAPAGLGFTSVNANSDSSLAAGRTVAALSSASGFRIGSAVRLGLRGHVIGAAAVAATIADGAGIKVTTDAGAETVSFHAGDFANPAAVTVAEVAAAINRQAVGFDAEITHDNRLALLARSDGPTSTIALAAPASGGDATTALGLTGAGPVAGKQAYRQLVAASETYRLIGWDTDPPFPAMPAAAVRVATVEFDLVVRRDGAEVERFGPVSMVDGHDAYVQAVVNDPRRGSAYLVADDLDSTSGVGLDAPAPGVYRLAGGDDGDAPADTAFLGDPAARTGLEAFNDVAIQLVACPESTSAGVATGAIAYCERRGDAMFAGTVPYGFDRDGAKAYASGLRGRKVFGALYAPWIQVVNPDPATVSVQPLVWVPPVGQVLGVYARITDARGVWKAPAGDEARLVDALGVEYDMTDTDHTDLVRDGGVNGIRALPGSGIVVDASRTLSTDTRWLFVNVRRLFNFVKSSLRDGLTWVAQEPNDESLRRAARFNVVTPFLLGLWRRGAFGSDPADQTFTVKCDAENNPPQDVANGIFTLEVYFYPAKPAEAILVVVGQQDSGATAAEG